MASRVGAVVGVQARLSSSRLPGKCLYDLAGEPLIVRLVERARAARRVDEVVVLTSVDPSDDPLVELCRARGIPVRRGPLADVYARYAALLDELRPRYCVRVTGDWPLVDPEFVDLQLEALATFDADFALVEGGRVDGTLGGQGAFSARALRSVAGSDDPRDREHVGSFHLAREIARFRVVALRVPWILKRPSVRLAVDEHEDYELLARLFERFAPEHGSLVPLERVLAHLDEHPELAVRNRDVPESAANRAHRDAAERARWTPVGRFPPGDGAWDGGLAGWV